MPEDMLTNSTSSPAASMGVISSIYAWGEIWEVVLRAPARMAS